MPRLVGKQTNPSVWLIPLIAAAAIGSVAHLEYRGTLNLIPNTARYR